MDNSGPFLSLRREIAKTLRESSIPFPHFANCIPHFANCIPQNRLQKSEFSLRVRGMQSGIKGVKVGNDSGIIAQRRGMPVYLSNPSIPDKGEVTRSRKRRLGDEHKGLVIDDGSGEVLGRGAAIAYEWEEVDSERFVKLFLAGVKQAAGLSKAGMTMFEMVYNKLREAPGGDKVELSFLTSGKSKATYYDGLRELLEKGFLYNSPYDGTFFVNIRYMFNGDRLAFIKAYHLVGAGPTEQLSLPGVERNLPTTLAPNDDQADLVTYLAAQGAR